MDELDRLANWVCAFDGDLDDVCDRLSLLNERLSAPRAPWRPPTDIYETPDSIVIKVALAGVEIPGGAEVIVNGREVLIRGCREDCTRTNRTAFHHMEISYGRFARRFVINAPFDVDRVEAWYRDGFLIVTLPKAEKPSTKRITLVVQA